MFSRHGLSIDVGFKVLFGVMKNNETYYRPLVLQTKLHRPPNSIDTIRRTALIERLEKARASPLVLVSAPAGYGKSTLVSGWVEQCDWSSAWISVDSEENDLHRFLTYFIAAVESITPNACAKSRDISTAAEMLPIESILVTLSNELNAIEQPILIVLDDYHKISTTSPVNELLSQLLRLPPIPLHIVIITRRDPALPLLQLRGRGQVHEIRVHDLKFDLDESGEFLKAACNKTIGRQALKKINSEVEGWAVGLRLVALALQQVDDPETYLSELRGGVQQTREYLIQEVIQRLAPELRSWLLKAAIFERFCGALCNAVCAGGNENDTTIINGEAFIKLLNQENLFFFSLDPNNEWFRFHHLFQELLLRELEKTYTAGEIVEFHKAASTWFETEGLIEEAIDHALTAGEDLGAADIVERHYHEQLNLDRFSVVERWLNKLPAETVMSHPALLLARAYIASYRQQIDKLVPLVESIQALLDSQAENPGLLLDLSLFRGYLNFWMGNTLESEQELEEMLRLAPPGKHLLIAEGEVHLGLSRYMNGKQAAAIAALTNRINTSDQSEDIILPRLIGTLSIIYVLAGDLLRSRFEARRMRVALDANHSQLNASWSDYLEGLSNLHNMNLSAAIAYLESSVEKPYSTDGTLVVDALAGLALAQELMGHPKSANEALQRSLKFAFESNDPSAIEFARSCQARLQLLRGDVCAAVNWAKASDDPPDRLALLIWLEAPHLNRARILISHGSAESLRIAETLLSDILKISEKSLFVCQRIEALVLQSLLLEKQGDGDAALASLQTSLEMAEKGRWLRPFVELGEPMRMLLQRYAEQYGHSDFLLSVFDAIDAFQRKQLDTVGKDNPEPIVWSGEALTNREIEILGLLAKRLRNKEIAVRLFVSTETVKTHLKHLYQKFGVSNRQEAVAKAQEMPSAARLLQSSGMDG